MRGCVYCVQGREEFADPRRLRKINENYYGDCHAKAYTALVHMWPPYLARMPRKDPYHPVIGTRRHRYTQLTYQS